MITALSFRIEVNDNNDRIEKSKLRIDCLLNSNRWQSYNKNPEIFDSCCF